MPEINPFIKFSVLSGGASFFANLSRPRRIFFSIVNCERILSFPFVPPRPLIIVYLLNEEFNNSKDSIQAGRLADARNGGWSFRIVSPTNTIFADGITTQIEPRVGPG